MRGGETLLSCAVRHLRDSRTYLSRGGRRGSRRERGLSLSWAEGSDWASNVVGVRLRGVGVHPGLLSDGGRRGRHLSVLASALAFRPDWRENWVVLVGAVTGVVRVDVGCPVDAVGAAYVVVVVNEGEVSGKKPVASDDHPGVLVQQVRGKLLGCEHGLGRLHGCRRGGGMVGCAKT